MRARAPRAPEVVLGRAAAALAPSATELARGPLAPAPFLVARALRAVAPGPIALLESALDVDGLGRFSFVGALPVATVTAPEGGPLRVAGLATGVREGEPLAALRDLLAELSPAAADLARQASVPFAGGAVVALAYDLGRRHERWPSHAAPLGVPDLVAHVFDAVLCWDHARARVLYLGSDARGGLSLEQAREALERARDLVATAPPPPLEPGALGVARSNFRPGAYRKAVARVRRYIRSGDVFQVNLAQRFEAERRASPDDLYAWLRALSPAPFAALFDLDRDRALVSSSPERFVALDRDGRIESWPIKGTRPRGATPAEDERLARELVASDKDAAELAMIVDLARNDLGRVARPGSVVVREARRLQRWPVVHHTVGVVEARLDAGLAWDALVRAAFPPASVTGAPKLRAIEIVDELEPVRRGFYTGALGYVGWDGALDLSVLIRTIAVERDRVHAHAGGGIVLDSDPEAERRETLAKARAILRVLSGKA